MSLGGLPASLSFEWVDFAGGQLGEAQVPIAKQMALDAPGVGVFLLRMLEEKMESCCIRKKFL